MIEWRMLDPDTAPPTSWARSAGWGVLAGSAGGWGGAGGGALAGNGGGGVPAVIPDTSGAERGRR